MILLVLVIGIGAGSGTTAASFSSGTRNAGLLSTATVVLDDDDSGTNLLTVSGMNQYDTALSCIDVDYAGSTPATVRLYGTSSGALAPHVLMTVTRGINSSTFPSCAGFTADPTAYLAGQPNGVIWTGPMSAFPANYAAGVLDPPTGAVMWTTGNTRAYKVELTVGDNPGGSATAAATTLNWEARNT